MSRSYTPLVLRFALDEGAERSLRDRIGSHGVTDPAPDSRTYRSIYFDTPDFRLKSAGLLVQLVRDGRRWLQSAGPYDRAATCAEGIGAVRVPVSGEALELDHLGADDVRHRIDAAREHADLAPIAETVTRRCGYRLDAGTEREVLVSIDAGEVSASTLRAPFREATFELIGKDTSALFDVATALMPDEGVSLSPLSQAERSYNLASGEDAPPPEPRTARAVPLDPDQTAESAARDILIECARQIQANIALVGVSDEPEAPHQVRIGLRRLRTALSLFAPTIGCDALDHLTGEARWLGKEVGTLRDLDVALSEIVEPEAGAHPDEPGFALLQEALAARRTEYRATLRTHLRARRVQALLVDLSRFVETRPWLDPRDYDQTLRLATPLAALSRKRLGKRWRKVRAYGQRIDDLGIAERHEMRKELKKLRYTVEFLKPVYPAKQVKSFVKPLKQLQEVFGALNDLAMTEALFTGPYAPCPNDPQAQRAIGRILGARDLRSDEEWHHARGLWTVLQQTGPFWD
ncbi:MAG: CHAD domain-containing protein [Pseudomonadota bacterium]